MPILISGENTALSFKYLNKSSADKLYVVASDGAVKDTLFIEGVSDAWKQTQFLLNKFIGKEISFNFSRFVMFQNILLSLRGDLNIFVH